MTTPRRVLLVSDAMTILDDGTARPTPAGSLAEGLAPLLERVQATMSGEGVLLLDARAAAALGLPLGRSEYGTGGLDEHQALTDVRAGGWSVSTLRPWATYHAEGRATVHVGVVPAIDPTRAPVVCPWPMDTVAAVRLWHDLIGTAYHGTPGVAGMALVRAVADAGTGKEPTWRPKGGPPEGVYEADYEIKHWRGKVPKGHRYAHGYDAVRMYLAAAAATPLTPWDLKRIPRMGYDGTRAGWWLATIAPWQDDRLPDPAGYTDGDGDAGKPRWVTGPTLALLDELVAEGIHGGYEILDSWTGPIISASGGRVLRRWAERLRDAGQGLPKPPKEAAQLPVYGPDGTAHRVAVAYAVKQAYRETWGMLNDKSSRVVRPDWHYAILAQARANLFRRIRRIAKDAKRYPLWIDVDNVWYPAATDDAVAECPAGITLAEEGTVGKLGQFTVKGSKGMKTRGN